ncbi:molybdopterin molybdotransferase MoeA [Campylobacter sp. RM9344]|uniref:Molybdopterin molybdenumtransferase n=1 Tax=Campylobacter californiensis TaxID=1032243 RepID=A0AAW3ZY39_9BACT|nr:MULTISPECIES: molybdopterin molybdotransferase MoeA [unclassified Campylobacter]MBE2984254.1 molybdopterin molybdotransferase MoeA [Campylobacter sp. RM6883]MBE2985991.1 molybdopterin molybdotransferase MoeA [Campylobacter sp. RM12919]MBE2988329.1 molybdopterin molybdotransferase MoeA [Campylobacter sp. RM12920]MBE2994879.1 molybdopterin molybdotransferase MoeA [Campylobacter sp. RM6913]MBE3029483.1 molybdopterin molybdotransferase MoeA [Campylobacter sp. RM9344]
MEVFEAIDEIFRNFNPPYSLEILPINEACGRILSKDVVAVKNLPCFDNSALDGYAVKFEDKDKPFVLIDSVLAGDKRTTKINQNECIKIMTGAKMPLGADTVMRLEECIVDKNLIHAPNNLKKGDAYRFAAEEVKIGEILLKKGEKLNARAVMMLAAQGISFVEVFALPRIGIYSSGDEIVEPWQNADDDQIYNANAVGIGAILTLNGFQSSYLGIIKDSFEATVTALNQSNKFDVIICSGGASKGEADFMKKALEAIGFNELFNKVNMRPGAPFKAYEKDGKMVFVLPGNPMAAYLCANLFILPLLLSQRLKFEKVTLKENIKIKPGRANIVLGSVDNFEFHVTNENRYGSGMIKPLLKSNAIYISNPSESEILANSDIFITRIS